MVWQSSKSDSVQTTSKRKRETKENLVRDDYE